MHFDGIFDGPPLALANLDSSLSLIDANHINIEFTKTALVECEFAVTKFVSGFEAAGIQEIQINRLFNFVRKLTGEKDPGEIRLNHFDRCHGMRIA